MTEHTCTEDRGLTPAQLTDLCPRCQQLAVGMTHQLTVFNGVDVPDDVARQVMSLLCPYNPDVYSRDCDDQGRAL